MIALRADELNVPDCFPRVSKVEEISIMLSGAPLVTMIVPLEDLTMTDTLLLSKSKGISSSSE